jgi:DNA-binding HxlR family transcriptional regulator
VSDVPNSDSWSRIGRPVLEALLNAERRDEDLYARDLRDVVPDVSERQFHNTLTNLLDAGFIAGTPYHEGGQRYPEYLDLRLLGPGRQELRDWPCRDPFETLILALDVAIAGADEEERTRLEKFKASALEVGQGVLTGLLTNLVAQIAGTR